MIAHLMTRGRAALAAAFVVALLGAVVGPARPAAADGTPIKASNLPGSQGAFIGQGWLGETTHVLLVEGAIGLIEGLAAMLLGDALRDHLDVRLHER